RRQRALEATREPHGEKLLGVGAPALPAELGGYAEIDLEHSVRRAAVAIDTAALHVGLGGVQRLRHRYSSRLLAVCFSTAGARCRSMRPRRGAAAPTAPLDLVGPWGVEACAASAAAPL